MDNEWTRFDSGESIGGMFGTNSNFMVPTNLVNIVLGLGRARGIDKINKSLISF